MLPRSTRASPSCGRCPWASVRRTWQASLDLAYKLKYSPELVDAATLDAVRPAESDVVRPGAEGVADAVLGGAPGAERRWDRAQVDGAGQRLAQVEPDGDAVRGTAFQVLQIVNGMSRLSPPTYEHCRAVLERAWGRDTDAKIEDAAGAAVKLPGTRTSEARGSTRVRSRSYSPRGPATTRG